MLLSHLFTKTSKQTTADADSINANLLTRAGFITKTMSGVYSYNPLGLMVLRSVERIVREEMDAIGAQEILLSALAPKEYWERTGRWGTLDVLFHVPAAGDSEYALNPTHEEIVVPLAQQYVQSYKDLPFGAYQIQTKFRNEPRAKSGILRGREFLMKDLYSFHRTQEDLETYYAVVQAAYGKIFERLGLASRTYFTYASGGSFSKYSHEYQVVLPQGEDTIYVSVKAEEQGRRIAVNKEIYEPGVTVCPETGGTEFREEKASEAANIFQLGTKFSAPFELMYADEAGVRQTVIMGCYGIGVSRLMGIIAESMSDAQGLVWPINVSPFRLSIVPICKKEDEEPYMRALALQKECEALGMSVLFDDRLDASVGSRLADHDLFGIPSRIIISPKTLAEGMVEYKDRASGTVTMTKIDDVMGMLKA